MNSETTAMNDQAAWEASYIALAGLLRENQPSRDTFYTVNMTEEEQRKFVDSFSKSTIFDSIFDAQ